MATSSSPFSEVAVDVLASSLAHDPVNATFLGEHRHDGMLPDPSPAAAEFAVRNSIASSRRSTRRPSGSADDRVDAAILRTALRAELFELDQSAPRSGIRCPAVRATAYTPWYRRNGSPRCPSGCAHLAQRLRAVPAYLAAARERLGVMSLIHLDTAQAQLDGTLRLLDDAIPKTRWPRTDQPPISAS